MLLIEFQLEQALGVAERDVKDASAGVLKELKRFQHEKEADLRRYMVANTIRRSLLKSMLMFVLPDRLRQMPH